VKAFLIFTLLFAQAVAAEQVSSLMSVLEMGERQSPRLKTEEHREQAAAERVRVEKSSYMPELDAAAIASTGDPGSFALLGVDNNISSSQRIGAGGALILKQDIWDFGRTEGNVHEAKAQREIAHKQIAVTRQDVDRELLHTYIDCAYLKEQVADSREIAQLTHLISRETDRFVRSGQRSVIERYLVDAEAQAADTRIAEFSDRVTVIEKRLGIEAGAPSALHCGDLKSIDTELRTIEMDHGATPLLEIEKKRVAYAEARLDRAKADHMPQIVALATGGYFDNVQTRDRMNYAAGVGVTLPLFEGFRVDASVQSEKAGVQAAKASLSSLEQLLNATNSKYDEQTSSLNVRLKSLGTEYKIAKQALTLARKRYSSLQGTMVDLRESIKNMTRVTESLAASNRELFLARGEKALLNGSRNKE